MTRHLDENQTMTLASINAIASLKREPDLCTSCLGNLYLTMGVLILLGSGHTEESIAGLLREAHAAVKKTGVVPKAAPVNTPPKEHLN